MTHNIGVSKIKLFIFTVMVLCVISIHIFTSNINVKERFDNAILYESFDSEKLSEFGRTVLNNRFTSLDSSKGIDKTNAIKVSYVGNERGSRRVLESIPIPISNSLTLSFSVKFCQGFDFAKGGKLHGLGPKHTVAGGKPITDESWSARLMWRRDGGLMTYVYHQDMKGKFGDTRVAADFRFVPNQYHLVEFNVSLNSESDTADGFIKVAVDGVEVIEHKDLRFRAVNSHLSSIQTLMFNTFHGGSSADWAPRNEDGSFKTDCAYFDDFRVTTFSVMSDNHL